MAEAEEHPDLTSESRPQTTHKMTGDFAAEDTNDFSTNKDRFEHSTLANAQAFASNNRIPSLDPATLPSLPPPTESSLLYNQSENEEHSVGLLDPVDEKEMQRHLNDVESSFMPEVSPVGMNGKTGADDTYLFDGPAGREAITSTNDAENDIKSLDSPSPLPTPADAYHTPGLFRTSPRHEEPSLDSGNTTSDLETMSSSPTAAAAARTISRAISQASMDYETAHQSREHSDDEGEVEATPKRQNFRAYAESSDGQSTLRHDLSNESYNQITVDAGGTPGVALLNRRSSGTRPKFLRSRHASQRSSVSSFVTNSESHDGSSDVTLGADYALQSGGSVPSNGFSRSTSGILSRSISLGSMASGIDDYESSGRILEVSLDTLNEEELSRGRKTAEQASPETPRPINRSLAPPTDTIIARHVRNVQVPESLAKEYRSKSGASSPNRRNGFSNSTIGRNGKNLTLKEQSSTIERLSKENFDLKLKVMFLSDRLDKLSEEGVKEMISENVELKTGLAVMQRDNKALRRKVKELEKQLKDDEGRPDTAQSGTSTEASPKWFDQEDAQEREEELIYLRERVEEYVTEIEKLRNEGLARENEKRNLTDLVRTMGERRGQNVDSREEMDVWKDLLEQETARREQSDEENKRLRDEIFRLKTETTSNSGIPGLNHTTNIYNITKKRQVSPSRPKSSMSGDYEDRNGNFSAASTLVEELRKESEQLRHENAELRREVGAQTSMLTSRNREKERLYQEIEDLKLGHRRGGSVAGDSIFERSASRAQNRSASRASAGTRQTTMTDAERDEFENKQAELRDKINSLKIQNQDLQRELESCMNDFEIAVEQKTDAEKAIAELEEALEVAEGDLLTMQADRDEALHGQEAAELNFADLQKEAQEELNNAAAEADEYSAEIERLRLELGDAKDDFNAMQNEMREMSESVIKLEDDHENNLRRIEELEKDLDEANRELEEMDKNLVEANGKINRLSVQQESSQGEIAFLREEQDGDKIKIGDLEAAVKNLEQSLQAEKERAEELGHRLTNERHQREVVASREKQEVQQFVNDLNREASNAKDEARRLRKSLTSREVEAAEWKQRLMELENNLREALGDLSGTRSSLLTSIAKLQRELENTIRDLDSTKASLTEKERQIKQRDTLLETAGLESRKLADMLDKERQAHRTTKHTYETYQKTTQHTTRTLTQQEARVIELENSRQQDRRKIATLESTFKDQLTERNNLLLALWNRLSSLCGSDWAHNNSLINGRALPSLEAVSTMLPGFSKNLLAAVKTIETLINDFSSRVKDLDKRLWKEYQNLEHKFELQTKKVDRLETIARSSIPGAASDSRAEISKLKDINRLLKTEISSLRAANEVREGIYGSDPSGSPAPSVPTGPRNKLTDKSRTTTMTRSNTQVVEALDRASLSRSNPATRAEQILLPGDDGRSDPKWQVRLKELESKLKAEREARKMDRNSAQQRLREKDRENAELAAEVERGRVRTEMGR